MDDTICVYPWTTVSVGSEGFLRPCCNATNSYVAEMDGTRSSVRYKHSTELMYTKTHADLREAMVRGEKPSICDRCWKLEAAGVPSFRNWVNERMPAKYSEIKEHGLNALPAVRRFELDLGNKCNLKCRMCGPFSSSLAEKEVNTNQKQYPEIREYYGLQGDNSHDMKLDNWVDVVDIKSMVEPHLDSLLEFYLIGGEPLIIEEHNTLIRWLVDIGKAKDITLFYNTNGIKAGDQFLELWKEFRHVQLAVSIDGFGKDYEYIRYPAKWEKIENNFIDIGKYQNINRSISATVQNLTMQSLPELIKFADSQSVDITYITVDWPLFLQPHVMPSKDFDYFVEEIEKLIPNIQLSSLRYTTNNLVNQLKSAKQKNLNSFMLQKDFIKKQLLLDKIRNQNLFEVHPWAKSIDD